MEEQPWWKYSVCADIPLGEIDFFPWERDKAAVAKVKKVCSDCPVKTECLDYAIDSHIHFGMWGGLTETERKRVGPARKLFAVKPVQTVTIETVIVNHSGFVLKTAKSFSLDGL